MRNQTFPGRLGLQQRVLPAYRVPFVAALGKACEGGLSVFAGQPLPEEAILPAESLEAAYLVPAHNLNFFPISSPFYQCWQANIIPWLENWQPHALVVEASSRYPSTRLAVRWMHQRGRKVVGWGLGVPPIAARGPVSRFLAFFRRWERATFLRSLDGIIAYSQQGAAEYRAAGFPAERVSVAPNATASRPKQPFQPRPPTFDHRPVVLFVGRLQARKRLDSLIRACASLPVDLQPRLCIVGEGPALDELQQLAHTLYPHVEFLGPLHGAELEPVFSRSDLFVLPGTGGLAVQQAMAHGLPVIVAEGDGTQNDLVRQPAGPGSGNGWLIPPNDEAALQAALAQALSDVGRLRRMGAESVRIVEEEINVEAMAQVFVELLSRLHQA